MMGQVHVKYADMKKRTRNSIRRNLVKLINKYGFYGTRCVVRRYFSDVLKQNQLEKDIEDAEMELKKLKAKKR